MATISRLLLLLLLLQEASEKRENLQTDIGKFLPPFILDLHLRCAKATGKSMFETNITWQRECEACEPFFPALRTQFCFYDGRKKGKLPKIDTHEADA